MAKSTVEKYRLRPRRPPSPSWRAFLRNQVTGIVALDFFTVPTVGFKVRFVLIVLVHDRRRVLHFNVTEHPTAQWTAQQLLAAVPGENAPRYLLRDRDAVCGKWFQARVARLGIAEVRTARRRPWQHPYAERLPEASGGSVWIMSSSEARATFGTSSPDSSAITTIGGRTCHWVWAPLEGGQGSYPIRAPSLQFRKWVDCIATTSGWLHDVRG